MLKIYLRSHALAIVELFEQVLDQHNITVPSEEDEQKDADNNARLYGMVYAKLEDDVVNLLYNLAKMRKDSPMSELVDEYGYEILQETAVNCLNIGGNVRSIRIHAGMTGECEIIRTDAPDCIIEAQIRENSNKQENGTVIVDPYALIKSKGFTIEVVMNSELDAECNMEVPVDAEFDLHQYQEGEYVKDRFIYTQNFSIPLIEGWLR